MRDFDADQQLQIRRINARLWSLLCCDRDDPLPKRMTFLKRKLGLTRDETLRY
ncbi:hypothetical protein LP417_06520 [Polaromonas sp. P1-6]|nr:hypothetical protein LP417_06520 [Polaromonas sp. P1-6]UUZ67333.1 hypothetical protein LP416_21495 [Polaromonas sp. P2-4]